MLDHIKAHSRYVNEGIKKATDDDDELLLVCCSEVAPQYNKEYVVFVVVSMCWVKYGVKKKREAGP